jgi:hypothetical protein
MSIVNRRNAVVGWLTWMTAKRVLKRKARAAVPGMVEGTRRPNKGALAVLAAVLGGLLWFWWSKSSSDEGLESPHGTPGG